LKEPPSLPARQSTDAIHSRRRRRRRS
jgi:hypothetical protein